jgi:hypothetical protein
VVTVVTAAVFSLACSVVERTTKRLGMTAAK